MNFEILIRRRPVSVGATNSSRSRWKMLIAQAARDAYPHEPSEGESLRLTIVYFYTDDAIDVDNIIKPIQDALKGIVYLDDSDVVDVDCHRRHIADVIDTTDWPSLLIEAHNLDADSVYILVRDATLEVRI